MTPEECNNHMTTSRVWSCTDAYCNGTECAYKYEEQPLCEDIGCAITADGTCMITTNRKKYTTNFPGYTCNNEYYNGNDCVYKNKQQPLCKDIGCDDQVEGDCMTEQNSKQYATTFPGYNCKGNDCVSKFKEHTLCKDIG